MKITLVEPFRMLAERAVHLSFRNQTYGKMAVFRHYSKIRGELLNPVAVSGVCTVHEKTCTELAGNRHDLDGIAPVFGESR